MYCDLPDLGRCCFCFPLRKGVIAFGYAFIVFNAFMIGLYSYIIHYDISREYMSFGKLIYLPAELSITICCFEIIFAGVLVYGAHMKSAHLLRVYYYFALTTAVAVLTLQIIDVAMMLTVHVEPALEMLTLAFGGLCIQIYLITVVRSLLKKLDISGPHVYDNQLHQIVSGDRDGAVENNGIYKNTTAPNEI